MSELVGPNSIEARKLLSAVYGDNRILVDSGQRTSDTSGIFQFNVAEQYSDGEDHFDGLFQRTRDGGLIFTADPNLSEGHFRKGAGLLQVTQGHMMVGALARAFAIDSGIEHPETSRLALSGFDSVNFPGMALPGKELLVDFTNTSGNKTDAALIDPDNNIPVVVVKGMRLQAVADLKPYLADHNHLEIGAQALACLLFSDGEGGAGIYRGVENVAIKFPVLMGDDLQIDTKLTLKKGTNYYGDAVIKKGKLEIATLSSIYLKRATPAALEAMKSRLG